jgi:hypothetical protein
LLLLLIGLSVLLEFLPLVALRGAKSVRTKAVPIVAGFSPYIFRDIRRNHSSKATISDKMTSNQLKIGTKVRVWWEAGPDWDDGYFYGTITRKQGKKYRVDYDTGEYNLHNENDIEVLKSEYDHSRSSSPPSSPDQSEHEEESSQQDDESFEQEDDEIESPSPKHSNKSHPQKDTKTHQYGCPICGKSWKTEQQLKKDFTDHVARNTSSLTKLSETLKKYNWRKCKTHNCPKIGSNEYCTKCKQSHKPTKVSFPDTTGELQQFLSSTPSSSSPISLSTLPNTEEVARIHVPVVRHVPKSLRIYFTKLHNQANVAHPSFTTISHWSCARFTAIW